MYLKTINSKRVFAHIKVRSNCVFTVCLKGYTSLSHHLCHTSPLHALTTIYMFSLVLKGERPHLKSGIGKVILRKSFRTGNIVYLCKINFTCIEALNLVVLTVYMFLLCPHTLEKERRQNQIMHGAYIFISC